MASRSLGSLTLDLVLRMGGFQSGMDKAARESEKSLKRIQSSAKSLQRGLATLFAGIGISSIIQSVVRNTSEAEDALAQLQARIKSTGNVAGVSVPDLQEFASGLQGITTFGDDAILQMQSLLLSFTNIRGNTVKDATRAILDVSTALGTDLNSAATLVGKALQDPVKGLSALGRVGVQFSKDQKELIKSLVDSGQAAEAQNLILKELQTRFGGAATAAANTFGGALEQVKNAFGDLLEAKGGVGDATKAIGDFAKLLRDPGTIAAAEALTTAVVKLFQGVTTAITETVNVTRFLAEELASNFSGPAGDDIVRLEERLAELQERAKGGWSINRGIERLEFFGKNGIVEWYSDAELEKEIGQIKAQLKEAYKSFPSPLTPPSAVGGATPGGAVPAAPSEAFEKLDAQLREQIALFGQSSEAAKLAYQIQTGAIEDLTEAEGRRLLGLAKQLDALKETADFAKEEARAMQEFSKEIESGAQAAVANLDLPALEGLSQEADQFFSVIDQGAALTESLRTPQEQYNETLAELNDLLAAGSISQETYSRALKKAQEDLKGANDLWTVFKDQAARNTQDIIADTLVNSFDDGAKGILKSFGEMIKQLIAQAVAADIAGKLFGTAGGGSGGGFLGSAASFLSGLFGGARAMGGPVSAGVPYLVGERGPEMIVPRGNATVIPNGALGGQTNHFNISIQAPNEQVGRLTANQAALAFQRQLSISQRRNG